MRFLSSLLLTSTVLCSTAFADSGQPHDPHEPRLAVATDPVGLLAGRYSLAASYLTWRRAAISANLEIIDELPGVPGSDTWRAAITVPIYLDRPFHGPYVEPGLAYADRFIGYGQGIGVLGGGGSMSYYPSRHARSIEPQIFVGWQWLFASRLHIAGAVGVSRHFATDGSGVSSSIPESYVRIGLAL